MIGGTEYNPGPVVEVENTVRLLCTGRGRNLKSGTQCEVYGRWYYYSCGRVKVQAAEKENWNCDECRTGKVRKLQDDLQNALRQMDELKARKRKLETTLLMAGTGKNDTMLTEQTFTDCKVIGNLILRKVRAEHADMNLECLLGLKPNSYTE
jgi:hypothetical protein